MLLDFLREQRSELIARTRKRVAARTAPRATEDVLKEAVPLFLDQLTETLQHAAAGEQAPQHQDATRHGAEMSRKGFTVAQLVHDYGDVCQAITELAVEQGAPISPEEFRTLNRCLDDAIAAAAAEFLRQREIVVSQEGVERLGRLAHEQRNLLNAAMLAFQVLRDGSVGIGGSTGAMLGRSLMGLRDLTDRSLAQVRVASGLPQVGQVELAGFIEEIEVVAALESKTRGMRLTVVPAPPGVLVWGDRQLLGSAVGNLLSNAFKFSHPEGQVSMRTLVDERKVLIEIEDECGGLPPGKVEKLFEPFEQRSNDRSGLGLGLAIARQAVTACGGRIRIRDLPGKGCIFAIELARRPAEGAGSPPTAPRSSSLNTSTEGSRACAACSILRPARGRAGDGVRDAQAHRKCSARSSSIR
jgi:signal transduction histidine kinase